MPKLELIADGQSVSADHLRRLLVAARGKGDQGAWDVVNALHDAVFPTQYRLTLVLTGEQMAEEMTRMHALAHTPANVKGYGVGILRDYGSVEAFALTEGDTITNLMADE